MKSARRRPRGWEWAFSPLVVTTAAFMVFLCAVVFLQVWHRCRNIELERRVRRLEAQWQELHRSNAALEKEACRLQSAWEIKDRLRRLGLDLRPPSEEQMLRLIEPNRAGGELAMEGGADER
ncbi:MAG: hypothetical protein J7M29_02150 [Verrucomicrobia bacterium]|nr:hypothetical protein [Verrucomicrobiota bacterium]